MSEDRKKQQWLIFGGLAGVGLLVIVVVGSLMNSSSARFTTPGAGDRVDESIVQDRTNSASPELTWVRQSRQDIDSLTRSVSELTNTINALRDQDAQKAQELADMREQYEEAILNQQSEIDALKQGGSGRVPAQPGMALGPNGENYGQEFVGGGGRRPVPGSPAGAAGNAGAAGPVVQPFGTGFSVDFNLKPLPTPAVAPAEEADARSSNVKSLKSYIPSGSYAPAVIISGVDASTGVVSRDNPVPVLARITGPATTASAGASPGRKINVTGCTVLGSAMGDLSSERVYVRLTSMTCMGRGDQVLEAKVAGLIAGSGKAGVRGMVVSREGNLVRNAAVAGALGGFADALSSAASIASANDGAETVGSVMQGAAAGMVGGGAGNAAQTLADYYIKRAEQYQPVVSLYAGTEVEVVFMEGVDLK